MIPLAWSFDTVGVFCRCLDDAALAFGVMAGYDAADLSSVADASVRNLAAAVAARPKVGVPWRLVEAADDEVRSHLEDVVHHARREGADVRDFDMPSSASDLAAAATVVVQAEASAYHVARFGATPTDYRPGLRTALMTGARISAAEYVVALRRCRAFRRDLVASLNGVDALLMPVAPAPAPKGLESTGDASFCAPWSYAGAPVIALPSGLSSGGLPLGVQLVGAPFTDERLLRDASWFEQRLAFDRSPRL
jgi:amidase